jgi:KDO2-lipid IV(A) lauroyltransferase
VRSGLGALRLAPDGLPRPDAPFGRGPAAARVLGGVIRAAAWGGSRLPAGAAHGLAALGGTAEWAARPAKRRRLAVNLGHAVGRAPDDPAVRHLVLEEVRNEARRSADLLWALGRPSELAASTRVEGRGHLEEALARGKGLILASLHLGGWEVVSAIPARVVPVRTTAIVTDDWLAWSMAGEREAAGLGLLYATAPVHRAVALLRRGEAILVLGETRQERIRSRAVRFCDAAARLPAGYVALARLCGTPIVPFNVLPRAPRRWVVTIEPPVDPPGRDEGEDGERRVLQELADRWTPLLRANARHWASVYPIDWLPVASGPSSRSSSTSP